MEHPASRVPLASRVFVLKTQVQTRKDHLKYIAYRGKMALKGTWGILGLPDPQALKENLVRRGEKAIKGLVVGRGK